MVYIPILLLSFFFPAVTPFLDGCTSKYSISLRQNRQNRHLKATESDNLSSFNVWDNIFDSSVLNQVDEAAKRGGLSHTLYDRQQESRQSNAVELAIESILTELNDNSRYAEYWWRDEWINLEAHADVDEALAKAGRGLRYPNTGHVLYLSIGDSVRGPTLLFLNPYQGSMVVVPAVESRLLRFTGDIVHAVPRPPLAYLDEAEGGSNHEIWTRIRRVEGVESEETTVYRRSVLLFNTWTEPPLDVSLNSNTPIIDGTVDVKKSSEVSKSRLINSHSCRPISNWIPQKCFQHNTNTNAKTNQINVKTPGSASASANNDSNDNSEMIRVKVGLLGDKERRGGRLLRSVELLSPRVIKYALNDPKCVSSVDVSINLGENII